MRIDNLFDPTTKTPAQVVGEKTQRDEFLRLFVAQLKHQDPLNPQNGAEFVAQLAQFATLEQTAETNQRLASLESTQAASSRATLASLSGHEVLAAAGSIQYDPSKGDLPVLDVVLDQPVTSASVVIMNERGQEVRRLDLGRLSPGETLIDWDGLDSRGTPVDAGQYTLQVRARNNDGQDLVFTPRARGPIGAVEFANGGTLFHVGSVVIKAGDIISLKNESEIVPPLVEDPIEQ